MKSVGEVMAIGRTWEESVQKALRTVRMGKNLGFDFNKGQFKTEAELNDELTRPTPQRIYAIAQALENGYSVDKVRVYPHCLILLLMLIFFDF